MNLTEKQHEIDLLGEEIGGNASAFLLDFKRLTVERSTDLRVKLREQNGRLRIVKNRLAKRAFDGGALGEIEESFRGQTAIAYPTGDDVVAIAKVLRDFTREHEVGEVKAGVLDGKPITPEEFLSLADLPSREELLAKALYLMQYPITGFATALNGVLRNIVVVLEQIRQQRDSQ
jgi:large subunit ribosomal protein L10